MCLKHFCVAGYRAPIDHDLTMASRLADKTGEMPDRQFFAPQELSIVCFRYADIGILPEFVRSLGGSRI